MKAAEEKCVADGQVTISQSFGFRASHELRLLPTSHKCRRNHGHNYTVTASALVQDDAPGDLSPLGDYLAATFDPRLLNEQVTFHPTSELLAAHLAEWFRDNVESAMPITLVAMVVSETATTSARCDGVTGEVTISKTFKTTTSPIVRTGGSGWSARCGGAGSFVGVVAAGVAVVHPKTGTNCAALTTFTRATRASIRFLPPRHSRAHRMCRLTSSHSFLALLESIRELLGNYPINAGMESIRVVIDAPTRRLITVQLATGSLGTVAAGIAEWNLTLAEGRRTVERSGDGGTVTLRLTGKIDEDGTLVEVCGTTPFDHRHFGTDLPPGQIIPVSFEDLAVLAILSRSASP